jgi:cytidine deaminase
MNHQDLIDAAMPFRDDVKRTDSVHTGGVAAALETEDNHVIVGVCIDASCGIGFCAEHSAIAELGKTKSMRIKRIVAVNWDGKILPPCGRCRELMFEIDYNNADTRVVLAPDKDIALSELLPIRWQEGAG